MSNGNWIAYVGPVAFPWGQAGSRRVYGISRSLVDCGYKVVVGSGQWGATGLFCDTECEDISYVNIGDMPKPGDSARQKILQLFYESGLKTVEWLNSMPSRPSHVITYGAGAPFMHRVRKWCGKNGIPLIADVVEWYDGTHMLGGYFGPFHLSAKMAMHYYYPRCDGVITISRYLEDYYRRSSAIVLRIPPTLDVSRIHVGEIGDVGDSKKIKIAYAGVPGKKDLLSNLIKGIATIDPLGQRFELEVLGPVLSQVERLLGGPVPVFVKVAGMIPQSSIPERLQQADFTVLLREPKRFANAGFSTKFVESLANGVPVIANLTSDLGLYLHDGVEGVICRDHSIRGLTEALARIQDMSKRDLGEMRMKAREQAERAFDFRNYVSPLSEFLAGVRR